MSGRHPRDGVRTRVSDRIVVMDKDLIVEQDVPDYMFWVSLNERTGTFLARSNNGESPPSGVDSDNPGPLPSLATEKGGSSMKRVFVLAETAVVVSHWYEVGERDEEHGVRIEVRTLTHPPRSGTASAAQVINVDGIILRVDIFDVLGKEPGNLNRAHYHWRFDGRTPLDRAWDRGLRADPYAWLSEQLSHLPKLANTAGIIVPNVDEEAADLRAAVPEIVAVAKSLAATECTAPSACLAATKESRHLVLEILAEARGEPGPDPRIELIGSTDSW